MPDIAIEITRQRASRRGPATFSRRVLVEGQPVPEGAPTIGEVFHEEIAARTFEVLRLHGSLDRMCDALEAEAVHA